MRHIGEGQSLIKCSQLASVLSVRVLKTSLRLINFFLHLQKRKKLSNSSVARSLWHREHFSLFLQCLILQARLTEADDSLQLTLQDVHEYERFIGENNQWAQFRDSLRHQVWVNSHVSSAKGGRISHGRAMRFKALFVRQQIVTLIVMLWVHRR